MKTEAKKEKIPILKECTTPEQHREENIFYDFKKLTRPSWSTRKIILKKYMQYSVLLNKDQQKMVFLVSKNIFSN